MDVLLDDDELLVRSAVRELLSAESPPERVREVEAAGGHDDGLWTRLGELGWLGLGLPESLGGGGAPLLHLGLLFEEAGRALAPVPLHSHTVASLALANASQGDGWATWLTRAATGEARLAVALAEAGPRGGASHAVRAARTVGGGWTLSGRSEVVEGAPGADLLVVSVTAGDRRDGWNDVLAVVDPADRGVEVRSRLSMAGDRLGMVSFDEVAVAEKCMIDVADGVDVAYLLAVALNCSMIVGATRRAAERAFDHAKERVAFGQPIGAFQAIAHMCADMITWVDGAELLTREALWRIQTGRDARLGVSAAKAFVNTYCQAALRHANQIHGGVAQIREHDQQLWYRRAVAWTTRFGTVIDHNRVVAEELRLGHADADADDVAAGRAPSPGVSPL